MRDLSAHINAEWDHLKDSTVFVACSAGIDSTVLATILKRLGFNVTVIHINYQLRGQDSDLDALFVKSFCRRERITCIQRTIPIQNQLENGGNLQEIARNVRYKWFNHITTKESKNYIALGHHQDDQVETFLLNLGRKAGIMGLACMLKEHNNIIRPLLDFSRAEIIDYAEANNIEWREDKSNSSNKYRRNLLRNIIIPEIKSAIPSIDQSIQLLIQSFQKTQEDIAEEVAPLVNTFKTQGHIETSIIKALDNIKTIEFLRQLNQPTSHLEGLIKLAGTQKGKKLKWGNTWLINEGDILSLSTVHSESSEMNIIIEAVESIPEKFDKNAIYLDASKVNGALQLRPWVIGDRISPIGMKGSKLISDVLSDAKLTTTEKESVYIIHDDINIHWCHGLTVGRKAIADVNSTSILKVTISPEPLK